MCGCQINPFWIFCDQNKNKMIHQLKTESKYFQRVLDHTKTFELRKNDRDFQVGDYLELIEIDDQVVATGAVLKVRVSYILQGAPWLRDGYCCMGLDMDDIAFSSEAK
jgi:hypothetical protein